MQYKNRVFYKTWNCYWDKWSFITDYYCEERIPPSWVNVQCSLHWPYWRTWKLQSQWEIRQHELWYDSKISDYVIPLATSPTNLQSMLDIVHEYAVKFEINISNSCSMAFWNDQNEPIVMVNYGNEYFGTNAIFHAIGHCTAWKHEVGTTILSNWPIGTNCCYALISPGVHHNAISLPTPTSLYNKIVIATLLYGSEIWNDLTKNDAIMFYNIEYWNVYMASL